MKKYDTSASIRKCYCPECYVILKTFATDNRTKKIFFVESMNVDTKLH